MQVLTIGTFKPLIMDEEKTYMYKIDKPAKKGFQWKEFTDTTVKIVQGENEITLNKTELKQLERLIGAKFKY
jgi:hypothetical protein